MQINITKEKVGYSAHIAELRIHTQGDTFEELLENIEEAIEGFYETQGQETHVGYETIFKKKPLLQEFSLVI